MEAGDRVVVADMEAGIGILTRMSEQALDMALLVAEPSVKSIEVARRAADVIAERRIGPALVVANRVRDSHDANVIGNGLSSYEVVIVPEDPDVARADREGASPLDVAADCDAVRAIANLAGRLEPAVGLRERPGMLPVFEVDGEREPVTDDDVGAALETQREEREQRWC